jgi:hypothetical protein
VTFYELAFLKRMTQKRSLRMWAGLLLPPIVHFQDWDWRKVAPTLAQKSAREVQVVDPSPYLYGEVFLSSNKSILYRVREEQGQPLVEAATKEAWSRPSLSFRHGPDPNLFLSQNSWNFPREFRLSSMELKGEKISFFPNGFSQAMLWFSNVGGGNWVSFYKSEAGAYLALDPVENLVVTLTKGRDKILGYHWAADNQLIRYFPCDSRNDVLVENAPELGISRFIFFKDGSPESYTVFDFSGSDRKSEITWVEAIDCRNFFVSGNFGLSRVRY